MEFSLFGIGILSWMTFLPVLGMVIVLLLPERAAGCDPLDVAGGHRAPGGAGRA